MDKIGLKPAFAASLLPSSAREVADGLQSGTFFGQLVRELERMRKQIETLNTTVAQHAKEISYLHKFK